MTFGNFSTLLICILGLSTMACTNEVKDTEGRLYEFNCKSGDCALKEKDADNDTAYLTKDEGRVLTVCPADNPGFNCRPLQCESSGPCSQLGGSAFTCDKDICQAPDRDLTPPDRLALCLAKTGEWSRTIEQLERLTMARACTGDCFLPAACLKP